MKAHFCFVVGRMIAGVLVLGWGALLEAASDRPNVLWICSDDHAAYVTGCYGNKQVRTPNIDGLAGSGVRFDKAYCNAPVCTASRAAFITGMYPRSVGVTLLRTPLPEGATTLAEVLGEAGYDTACWGKTHYNSALKHGFDILEGDGRHRQVLTRRGAKPVPEEIEYLPDWKPFNQPARLWVNAVYHPFRAVDEDMNDTWYARRAAEYLRESREKPFFVMVSFHAPHSPFRFPVEYGGRSDPKQMPVYKVGPEDDWQIPQEFRGLSEEEKQGVNASYYTATEFMDKNVGIVLEALEKSGRREDTVVVYTGDHGYMLGQHGRFEKHCSYEPAVRSPLVLRYPKVFRGGRSTSALVEFIDIMPTVLDLCGVPAPGQVQGRSLKRLLLGETNRHRERVFVEYAQNDEVMVRDEDWKLVYIRGKRERTDGYQTGLPLVGPKVLLFDLKEDPDEFVNLAGQPAQKERVDRYVGYLVDFLRRTSRHPERIPRSEDPMVLLDYCVQPQDGE